MRRVSARIFGSRVVPTAKCVRIISRLSWKRKVSLMRSPLCVSVSPLTHFEPFSWALWHSVGRSYHWRWPWCHTNHISSNILKRNFELLGWMKNSLHSTRSHAMCVLILPCPAPSSTNCQVAAIRKLDFTRTVAIIVYCFPKVGWCHCLRSWITWWITIISSLSKLFFIKNIWKHEGWLDDETEMQNPA
jgi:hypothetical protein